MKGIVRLAGQKLKLDPCCFILDCTQEPTVVAFDLDEKEPTRLTIQEFKKVSIDLSTCGARLMYVKPMQCNTYLKFCIGLLIYKQYVNYFFTEYESFASFSQFLPHV